MVPDLYKYKARILRVIDGDTVEAEIDLGLAIFTKQKLRLSNIDSPEVRGEDKEKGKAAAKHLVKLLVLYATNSKSGRLRGDCSIVYVATTRDRTGKYGRYLAELWGVNEDGALVNINQQMIDDGHAEKI